MASIENKQARGKSLGKPRILNDATNPLLLRHDFKMGKNREEVNGVSIPHLGTPRKKGTRCPTA